MSAVRLKFLLGAIVASCVAMPCAYSDQETKLQIDALNARLQRIERLLDNQALLEMSKRIQELQQEVQQLRGENEQLAHEIETLKSQQRELYSDIDRRLQSLGSSSGVSAASVSSDASTAPPSTTAATPNAAPATATQSTSASISSTPAASTNEEAEVNDYRNAFTLLKKGRYEESITGFRNFLVTYPGSKFSANAQYWLAEANYVYKKYPEAVNEFKKVINDYPISVKVPDAKLKLGFAYYELGQYDDARMELTRLRAQFPNSTVAGLAQQRLERMSQEGH